MNMENGTLRDVTQYVVKGFVPKFSQECNSHLKDFLKLETYCKPVFDMFICWRDGVPGVNASHPCPILSSAGGEILGYSSNPELYATRFCQTNGQWSVDVQFDICRKGVSELYVKDDLLEIVAYINFPMSILSLTLLAIALFIFCHFKSLQCARLKVHRNLCLALIIRLFFLLINSSEVIFNYSHFRINWLCKTLIGAEMYSIMVCINWMFLEGLLLHNKVAVVVFDQDVPFKMYYFIGWVLPAILTGIWGGLLNHYNGNHCWGEYQQGNLMYIVLVPITTALFVNLLFLINIIRIIITKRSANFPEEGIQIRRGVKATALLFPLLGIPYILFCFPLDGNLNLQRYFIIANAFVQSSQGLFVSVLHCFINSEVQKVIKNSFERRNLMINQNGGRRQMTAYGSRSSHTYVSSFGGVLPSGLSKVKIVTSVKIQSPDAPSTNGDSIFKLPEETIQTRGILDCKDAFNDHMEKSDESTKL